MRFITHLLWLPRRHPELRSNMREHFPLRLFIHVQPNRGFQRLYLPVPKTLKLVTGNLEEVAWGLGPSTEVGNNIIT